MRQRILFLGDSLTEGWGLFPGQSMPDQIQKHIDRAGLPLDHINGGYRGDTTFQALRRLPAYLKDPGIAFCVIELGTNDWIQGYSVSDIERGLAEILAALRSYRADLPAAIVEMKSFPGYERSSDDSEYDGLFARFAEKHGLFLLPFPFMRVAGRAELNQSDGIHPNLAGTEIYAADLWHSLGPILQKLFGPR